MYQTVEHIADIAIEIEAADRKTLFKDALRAVIDLLTKCESVEENTGKRKNISISKDKFDDFTLTRRGYDDEEKLVGILSELLYQCQVEGWYPVNVDKVSFSNENTITAKLVGIYKPDDKRLVREIKAVTYHDLKIIRFPKWYAKIVFDV